METSFCQIVSSWATVDSRVKYRVMCNTIMSLVSDQTKSSIFMLPSKQNGFIPHLGFMYPVGTHRGGGGRKVIENIWDNMTFYVNVLQVVFIRNARAFYIVNS